MNILRALLTAWVLLCAALGAGAQDVQPVPALNARVIDQTATLSEAQRGALEAKLAAFEAQSGPQIVVLVVASTAPEDIASYAQRVGDSWKIGRKGVGDGVLLLWSKNERRVRIEVAKALEGAIPDLAARQIIDQRISPAFKAQDYAGGLNAGLDALIGRIQGENLPAPAARSDGNTADSGLPLDQLAIFLFVAVPLIGKVLGGIFGRKLGTLFTAGAAGTLGWWFTTSVLAGLGAAFVAVVLVGIFGIGSALRSAGLGRSGGGRGGVVWGGGGFAGGGGFSGGSSSSDSFSSGGGGDFGGGGASGDY